MLSTLKALWRGASWIQRVGMFLFALYTGSAAFFLGCLMFLVLKSIFMINPAVLAAIMIAGLFLGGLYWSVIGLKHILDVVDGLNEHPVVREGTDVL